MMRLTKIILIMMVLIFKVACQKKESTTTGNPMVVNLSISSSQSSSPLAIKTSHAPFSIYELMLYKVFALANAAPPPTMLDYSGNSVTLSQGWMVVKEVEFKATETPDANETDGDDIKFLGPYVVDLFAATPLNLGSSTLSLSVIQRIKMKLHKLAAPEAGAPSALVDNSIYFQGTVLSKEFSISSTEGTEFEVGGSTPLAVHDQMNLLLSLRIVPLINKIDLTAIGSESSGVVISESNPISVTTPPPCPTIDPSSTTIYDCFRKGLEQQANLGEDADQSGDLEDGEEGVR